MAQCTEIQLQAILTAFICRLELIAIGSKTSGENQLSLVAILLDALRNPHDYLGRSIRGPEGRRTCLIARFLAENGQFVLSEAARISLFHTGTRDCEAWVRVNWTDLSISNGSSSICTEALKTATDRAMRILGDVDDQLVGSWLRAIGDIDVEQHLGHIITAKRPTREEIRYAATHYRYALIRMFGSQIPELRLKL